MYKRAIKFHRRTERKTADKVAMLEVGQPCRDCGTPVIRCQHGDDWQPPKPEDQSYYFTWWLKCPKCKKKFMIECAKVWTNQTIDEQLRNQHLDEISREK